MKGRKPEAEPRDPQGRVQLGVLVSPHTRNALRYHAKREGLSMSSLVEHAINQTYFSKPPTLFDGPADFVRTLFSNK